MNMDKALSCTCGQIVRCLWNLFLPAAIVRWKDWETVWCQLPILIRYQRCWEGLQLQDGRSDTSIAEGVCQRLKACSWYRSKSNITVLVHVSHFCTACPLPHYAQPADKQTDTEAQFLPGIIFKLKRQVSSTMVIFTCMQETEDYDQNKHQNL